MSLLLPLDSMAGRPPTMSLGSWRGQVSTLTVVDGRPADGLPILAQALAIHKQAYGPDHPQVAANLNNLAQVLPNIGHHDANSLLEQALLSLQTADNPGHPDLTDTLRALANWLTEQSDTGTREDTERYPDSQGSAQDIRQLGSSVRQIYKLSDVFKRNGVPTVTFVEPPDFARFRRHCGHQAEESSLRGHRE